LRSQVSGLPRQDFKELKMKNSVLAAIKSRRSIRKYLPAPLKEKELQAILEAGAYAPSAHNEQAWHLR